MVSTPKKSRKSDKILPNPRCYLNLSQVGSHESPLQYPWVLYQDGGGPNDADDGDNFLDEEDEISIHGSAADPSAAFNGFMGHRFH